MDHADKLATYLKAIAKKMIEDAQQDARLALRLFEKQQKGTKR